jgi:hypothetical protein
VQVRFGPPDPTPRESVRRRVERVCPIPSSPDPGIVPGVVRSPALAIPASPPARATTARLSLTPAPDGTAPVLQRSARPRVLQRRVHDARHRTSPTFANAGGRFAGLRPSGGSGGRAREI